MKMLVKLLKSPRKDFRTYAFEEIAFVCVGETKKVVPPMVIWHSTTQGVDVNLFRALKIDNFLSHICEEKIKDSVSHASKLLRNVTYQCLAERRNGFCA